MELFGRRFDIDAGFAEASDMGADVDADGADPDVSRRRDRIIALADQIAATGGRPSDVSDMRYDSLLQMVTEPALSELSPFIVGELIEAAAARAALCMQDSGTLLSAPVFTDGSSCESSTHVSNTATFALRPNFIVLNWRGHGF